MSQLLLTGYPGFITGRLMEALAASRDESTRYQFIVQERFFFVAKERLAALAVQYPHLAGRCTVLMGDITSPDLGLKGEELSEVTANTTEVWHLAALYDLAVSQAVAYSVNVDGTGHVVDLCLTMPKLERLMYISTCYVSGDRTGTVYEDELDCGQGFKNHYESTKHWAERRVRSAMKHLPTTIIRPAIVVGDSQTGEFAKADGPYLMLSLLTRLPKWLPFVKLGASTAEVNLVPVDYVVRAMVALSENPEAIGKTVALADANPFTSGQLTELFCKALHRAPVVGTLPDRLASKITNSRRISRLTGIPRQATDYFNHPVHFDVSNARALLSGVIEPVPRFDTYLPALVAYAKQHPHLLHGGGK